MADQHYARGWQVYRFAEVGLTEGTAHGSDVVVRAAALLHRGPGRLHMTMAEIPPNTDAEAVGLHVHRDCDTGQDVEELYVVISGVGRMTFTNGDTVTLAAGDTVSTYPGTGHSFRAVGEEPVRFVAVVPHAFRSGKPSPPTDIFPTGFDPKIRILDVDSALMNPLSAECRDCSARWVRRPGDRAAGALPVWALDHGCAMDSDADLA